jgi:hypothetical protein
MNTNRLILIISLGLAASIILFTACNRSGAVKQTTATPIASSSSPTVYEIPQVDLSKYNDVRAKIEAERVALFSRYQRAATDEQKEIINRARDTFIRSIYAEIFPYWYGTPWDFNGTTETPRKGKIACGYFVSTALRDLGVKVQRAKLAQQASENIILSLTTNEHTKRFRQTSINDFVQAVKNWGPGLYVVGLDIHVGFIVNTDNDVYFIHSSYVDPYRVIKERGLESKILASSRYRVLGKLSEDDDLILKWLTGDGFTTRTG